MDKINIEYKKENSFPLFLDKIKNKIIGIMCDKNTCKYAYKIQNQIQDNGNKTVLFVFNDSNLVPNEQNIKDASIAFIGVEYILSVGSGTLNDMGKAISFNMSIKCGILATAPSMDGYCSSGSAVIQKGKKVTLTVHSPEDILIDLDIICSAPQNMIAAGFGDIIGKFTCLADWKLSNIINNEEINEESYSLMLKARNQCMDTFNGLVIRDKDAIKNLMEALVTAGISMAICGNSRPASGGEHHISHYLETDFISKNKEVPLHGIKVAIGTLISIELYNYLEKIDLKIESKEKIFKIIDELPKVEEIKDKLVKLNCPVKFSEIGVEKKVMEEMLLNAYRIRPRYTILTLYNELDLMKKVVPYLMKKYY